MKKSKNLMALFFSGALGAMGGNTVTKRLEPALLL